MTEQIDLDDICADHGFFFDYEPPAIKDLPSGEVLSKHSSDSMSSWIGGVESLLMADEVDSALFESDQKLIADFLSDILVDSSAGGSDTGEEAVDWPIAVENFISVEGRPEGRAEVQKNGGKNSAAVSNDFDDGSPEKETDMAYNDSGNGSPENESAEEAVVNEDGARDNEDDPVAKKRKRQLRNRDAALRSRERKKIYVKDLEMKSKYLEGECMRLGRLLQCVIAENQALRLCLQKGGTANDASVPKQESAVLFWESLLLGSLLWSLGIVCLFPLIQLSQSPPEPVQAGPARVVNGVPRGRESKMCRFVLWDSFSKSRKCKASRTRIREGMPDLRVLA